MNPYVGEIKMVGFNFAPQGWALCQGQLMTIAENTALFTLLGTTFGGDGRTTFALPDLRGRVPLGAGQGPGLPNYVPGQTGVLGGPGTLALPTTHPTNPVGHFLAVNFIIALFGVFPPQS